MMHKPTLIVGLGSDFGDDQVGLMVASRLARDLPAMAVRQLRSPAQLLDVLDGVSRLYIVDACRGAGEVGSILHCTWPSATLGQVQFAGTHDLDLASALQLANELRLLPPQVSIWAIESSAGGTLGCQPSTVIHAAIERLLVQMKAELAET